MGEQLHPLSIDCPKCTDDIGPPPDDILNIPPPPLPYFLQLDSNASSSCYPLCAWAPRHPTLEFVELTNRNSGSYSSSDWFFILGLSALGVLLFGALLAIFLIKFRCKVSGKSSIQVASTIVNPKGCDSVLYPHPPPPVPDGRVLWATLTPRGKTHHYTTPGSRAGGYSSPSKPSLPPPDPPISFENTGFIDSDSQSTLVESYQLSELAESDGASDSSTLRRFHKPRVSSPTKIDHPNLPPLNLLPYRSARKGSQRRNSDVPCRSSMW